MAQRLFDLFFDVISILGVEGSPEDFYNYGASTFMDSVEPQTDYDLRICLAHVPTYFPEHLENYSFELGLAGHTQLESPSPRLTMRVALLASS